MTLPIHEQELIEAERNILTSAEARAIPTLGAAERRHRSWQWPKWTPVKVWDMAENDIQSNSPDDCLPDEVDYTVRRGRIIMCRLLYKAYTAEQADARCKELHGTRFDGRYASGRYWCYYNKG